MSTAGRLVALLREPGLAEGLSADEWAAVLTCARAEQLLGSLAHRLDGLPLPSSVAAILASARAAVEQGRTRALWEAEMARRTLAPLHVPLVLLKGTAYVAAGLAAGQGRSIGDLDILVPRERLVDVERALLAGGWEWVKPDPYDDAYYRRWMHELPPLIHRERDGMIDVHHTILPLTARPKPDAGLMIADAQPLGDGLAVLSPENMVIHAAAHLIADGDLAGGLRNLWDIDRLVREFGETDSDFCLSVYENAHDHRLSQQTIRALRLAGQVFGTPVKGYRSPIRVSLDERPSDRLFRRRLFARDGWGRATRPATRLAFYVRGHALRMPPAMLARHLFTKWRRGGAQAR